MLSTPVGSELPIVIKMLPIVIVAAMWGCEWHGRLVTCHCDNQAVVAVLALRTSHLQQIMHLYIACISLRLIMGFS